MTEIDVLARTLYGEARNQGIRGMEAVVHVILNRLAVSKQKKIFWWGNTIEEICLKNKQFSCWNYSDPNRERMLFVTSDDPEFKIALEISEDACAGLLIFDPTNGATHYYNPSAVQFSPAWAVKEIPLKVIGDHNFYRPREVPALIDKGFTIVNRKKPSFFGWIWHLFFK